MSSCPSNQKNPLDPGGETFEATKAIRTEAAGREIEEKLWNGVVAECLLPDGLGGVFDMAFHVDRKTLVIQALKNIIGRLEKL